MKSILITGAGGTPAVNFCRSLRMAKEKFDLIGVDCSKYYVCRAETNERYMVPLADEHDYIDVLNKIIDKSKATFVHIQNDAEMAVISENREKLHAKVFLPPKEVVKICHNKLASHKIWKEHGIPQPKTFLITTADDLWLAWKEIEGEIWIRDTVGAGGRGSLKTKYFKTAKSWVNFKQGWGRFTAAEYLTDRSTTWQSIWHNGNLVVAQERERVYWELNKLAPSGVTGATGCGITANNPKVSEIALKAILAISPLPHGIFSVDLTYDKNGIPNPTEINIGRFFTTHHFFTKVGCNFPYIFVKLAYGEEPPIKPSTINPLPNGMAWIRGMDFEPILTTVAEIDNYEKQLQQLRGR